MTKDEFIEKAIQGGAYTEDARLFLMNLPEHTLGQVWMNPKAWDAVGEVEGWNGHWCKSCKKLLSYGASICREFHPQNTIGNGAYPMHKMIDHLIDGGTIETYIETL